MPAMITFLAAAFSVDFVFRLCDPIEKFVDNHVDVYNFYESLADNFAGVVQYNKDNRVGDDITIDTVSKCKYIGMSY